MYLTTKLPLLHHSFDEKNNLNTIEDCIRSNKSAKYNFEKSGKISLEFKRPRIY